MTRHMFIIHFHTILSICKYEKILLLDSMTNLWAKKGDFAEKQEFSEGNARLRIVIFRLRSVLYAQ